MSTTEKLYYAQPPIGEFSARVLSCESCKNGWQIQLSATAFYPEGGGQPADRGSLSGVQVLDVQEKDGCILHFTDGALPVGETVTGRIDMARRWDNTQQHSGEHILSGILHSMFGAENLGFHISDEYLTMDTSVPISDKGLAQAELRANQVIWENQLLDATWYEKEQLKDLTYRSKKELEGPVRIVTIPHADCCACCGTHVERTGQVGMVKIIDWHNYKQGVRLFVVCGGRALKAFEARRQRCAAIGNSLSAKFEDLTQAVDRQKQELEQARYRVIQLENEMFDRQAESYPAQQPVILEQPGLEPDALRRLAAAFGQKRGDFCALFSSGKNGCFYVLADPAKQTDLKALCNQMNTAFNGRGGGKPGFVQGSFQNFDFSAADKMIREFLQL